MKVLVLRENLLCSPCTDAEKNILSYSASGEGLKEGRLVEEKG